MTGAFEKQVEEVAFEHQGWLATLDDNYRERVFAVMRKIDKKADFHFTQERNLTPRGGAVAVGGAHFDEFLRGNAIRVFNRVIGKGQTPDQAREMAQRDSADAVKKWNRSRGKDFQVHRSTGSVDPLIDTIWRQVLRA